MLGLQLGTALLLLRPQLPRKMRPRSFLFTGSPNFLINCMTISDYNRKPVRRDRAIFFLNLLGFTFHWSTFKLYSSDHLGLVKVSHDD